MSSSLIDVVSTAAEIAASGSDVEEKVAEILDAAEPIARVDGWMIWGLDPMTGQRHQLYAKGYPADLMTYLDGPDFEVDVLTPFAQAETGWPARVRDLPFRPSDLRCMSEFYLPVGFVEGLVAPLASTGGRLTGFLDSSATDRRNPSDEARQLMSHLSRVLGRLIDPVEESRRAAQLLAGEQWVLRMEPGRRADAEPGQPPIQVIRRQEDHDDRQVVEYFAGLIRLILESKRGWWTTQFFWEGAPNEWFRCRCVRRHDGGIIVGLSRLERLPYGLSRRELDVLTLVADGARNDDIASSLVVTTRTVKAHVQHILEKLDVSSRSAATRTAIEEGILLRPPQNALVGGGQLRQERWPLPALRSATARAAHTPSDAR